MEFLYKLVSQVEFIIAGFVGSVVVLPFQKDLKTKVSIFIFISTGIASAYYLTGFVSKFFQIEPSGAGGVGFLLGAFGGSLIAATIRMIQTADPWGLIVKRFGGGS